MAPTIPSKTLVHLEWSKVLERLSTYCRGPVAHAAALALDFPADGETLRRRLARTDEARRLLDAGRTVPLGEVPDVRAVAKLAARGGVLEPDALGAIGVALETSARCARALDDLRSGAPELARIGERLVTHRFGANDLAGAFAMARSRACIKAVVEHEEVR
ncbi:MAG: hypothetical protein ACOYLX_12745 [Burkholderiaceae bacterium]